MGCALTQLAIAAAVVELTGCELVVGTLTECSSDTQCASKGPTVMCQNGLCVTDERCSIVGVSDAGSIVVGLIIDLTDPVGDGGSTPDPNGPYWKDAVELIVDQINPPNQQGIDGRPLEVVVCDDQSSPTVAADLAQRLVSEGVQAIMSGDSSETLNVAAVTVPAKVLLLSGYSQSPEITSLDATVDGVRLIWRTIESDDFVTAVLIQQITDDAYDGGVGVPQVAALVRNDSYGQGFYGVFEPAYPGPQSAFYFDPSGDNDVTGLTAANGYQPQLSILWAFPQDIDRLLGEIDTGNAYPNLQGSPWYFCDQMLVPGTVTSLSNPSRVYGASVVAAAPYDANSPAFAWLQTNYQEAYQQNPGTFPSVASYADAMMLIAIAEGVNAAENKPLTGVNLASVLGNVSAVNSGPLLSLDPTQFTKAVSDLASGTAINVQGASGPLDFNSATGEAPATTLVYQINSGGFTVINTFPPAE
jgi:branched-chain amino acid transport system substrate-binding protein